MNPNYPIYIPSKGRHQSRMTMKALDKLNVPYYVVIEEQEFDNYSKVIDKDKILILPFSVPNSNSELVKSRNWIKQHSISIGAKRHWQFDDNILAFYRLNHNRRIYVDSGTIFRVMEDFVDRYENVAIAGLNYMGFAKGRDPLPPYYLNTRIYSMSLVNNEMKYEWRGVYNDDTDICLRALKDGYCTILFNAFLGDKTATMRCKGGNTPIYEDDGRKKMAESLVEQHPDVVSITWKFNRWQHHVDYSPFKKNKLIRKKGITIQNGVNNYGMVLKRKTPIK